MYDDLVSKLAYDLVDRLGRIYRDLSVCGAADAVDLAATGQGLKDALDQAIKLQELAFSCEHEVGRKASARRHGAKFVKFELSTLDVANVLKGMQLRINEERRKARRRPAARTAEAAMMLVYLQEVHDSIYRRWKAVQEASVEGGDGDQG